MYYEEKVIEGVMYYRSHPNDNFMKMSDIQMTNALLRSRIEIGKLKSQLEEDESKPFMEK